MPDTIARQVMRKVEPLDAGELVAPAVGRLLDVGLPALPAVEADGSYAGLFGGRELLTAVFPSYLSELRGSAMISSTVDQVLERHVECAGEPIRGHLDTSDVLVDEELADSRLVELFLHHRVPVVPVASGGRVDAVVPFEEFSRAVGRRLVAGAPAGQAGRST